MMDRKIIWVFLLVAITILTGCATIQKDLEKPQEDRSEESIIETYQEEEISRTEINYVKIIEETTYEDPSELVSFNYSAITGYFLSRANVRIASANSNEFDAIIQLKIHYPKLASDEKISKKPVIRGEITLIEGDIVRYKTTFNDSIPITMLLKSSTAKPGNKEFFIKPDKEDFYKALSLVINY